MTTLLRRAAGWLGLGMLLLGQGCASTQCREGAATAAGVVASQREAKDGVCLQGFRWAAEGPKGVVVVVHGLRDHATRYETLTEELTKRGYEVRAQDMRGHGQSGGARQRFDSVDQLVMDLDPLVQQARQEHPGHPVFLYGHSLGGLLSAHYALKHQGELAGLVLSGAALKLQPDVGGGKIAAARFFGVLFPWLKAQELDDSVFVSTPEARASFLKDPLVVHEDLPAASARAAVNAIEEIGGRFEQFTMPLLVMHGDQDKTTNIEGSRELVTRARSTDKTLKLWEGQAHDLLHEPAAPQIREEVAGWIERHTAP